MGLPCFRAGPLGLWVSLKGLQKVRTSSSTKLPRIRGKGSSHLKYVLNKLQEDCSSSCWLPQSLPSNCMYTNTPHWSSVTHTKWACMWTSQVQCVNWNQGQSCIVGDCLCWLASDFLMPHIWEFRASIYLVLPLGHISESDSNMFCFSGVPGSRWVPSLPSGGRRTFIKDSSITWTQTQWDPGTHILTPFYVNPDMLLLILIRQIKLARRLR